MRVKEFPLSVLRDISKQAGGKRISKRALMRLREIVSDFSEDVARESVELANHAERKTVMRSDVEMASRRYSI